jgi:hypothetical protein
MTDFQDDTFDVVSIAIGDYDRLPPLEADAEAERVTELFGDLGGVPVAWVPEPGPKRDGLVVNGRLRDWVRRPDGRNSVLFWVGHGQSNLDGAWLATCDTPEEMNLGGVTPRQLADFILAEWQRRMHGDEWTIVVIEACGAERFVNKLHSLLLDDVQPPIRFAVIGVGPPDGPAQLGDFSQALTEVLSPASATYTDCDDVIKLHDLVDQLGQRLRFGIAHNVKLHLAPPIPRRRTLPAPVSATLDVYAELREYVAALPEDERFHFLPKAQGADQFEQGIPAWYFVGRDTERAAIAAWLCNADAGMLVVTGPAGSGKSALLGHVLVHSNPKLRELLTDAQLLQAAPPEEFTDRVHFDAVIHMTGLTATEVLARLSEILGEDVTEVGEFRAAKDAIVEALWQRGTFTVLFDALDEAQNPEQIASEILAPMAEIEGVRVVVGTRVSTNEGPDLPVPHDENLIDALGANTRLDVTRDPSAIRQFVATRLRTALDIDATTVDWIAGQIEQCEQQFLYARLAVHEIIADPRLVHDRGAAAQLLSGDHRSLFGAAVERITTARPQFLPLLQALALALGRGVPRVERVWLQVAAAISPNISVTEPDISDLLTTAAPYVMLDREHGQSVFRLAHRTFVEHFDAVITPDHHRAVAMALMRATRDALPALPNSYIRYHLARHVGYADAWEMLESDEEVRNQLDPTAVVGAMRPVRYSDDLEHPAPDEDEVIEKIANTVSSSCQRTFKIYRHGTRFAHAKGHGILRGELTVYADLPATLRQGLFEEPRTYPVIARLSSTSGTIRGDRTNWMQGLAIKVIGVEGMRALPGDTANTQDFTFVTHSEFPFKDAHEYLNRGLSQSRQLAGAPDSVLIFVSGALGRVQRILNLVGRSLPPALETIAEPSRHILGMTFFSAAPLRFGDYVAKLCITPCSKSVTVLQGRLVPPDEVSDAFRDMVVDFFAANSAEYEVKVQLCTDPVAMPIEDATVTWPQSLSPYVGVAKLRFDAQTTDAPERWRFGDDVLSFNPWRGLEAHRPLGSINRLKKLVYEVSSDFRHHVNSLPRIEPADVTDLPD